MFDGMQHSNVVSGQEQAQEEEEEEEHQRSSRLRILSRSKNAIL